MKKFLCLIIALLVASNAFAGPYTNTRVTSNTVSFNTTGFIVSFNTVVSELLVINESTTDALWVFFDRIGWNEDMTVYTLPQVNKSYAASGNSIAFRILPDSSVSLDLKKDKVGFDSTGSGTVTYIATSEVGQP